MFRNVGAGGSSKPEWLIADDINTDSVNTDINNKQYASVKVGSNNDTNYVKKSQVESVYGLEDTAVIRMVSGNKLFTSEKLGDVMDKLKD